MQAPTNLAVGDNVTISTKVGNLGATGNVTGSHLHLELSDVPYWDTTRTHFSNPLEYLGIPNARGTIVHYEEYIPPEPSISKKKNKFPWILYARKLRNKKLS